MSLNKKKGRTVFVVVCVACCLLPLASYPIAGNQDAESAESSKAAPSLMKNGKFNKDFFSDAGDFFSYNFGLRQNLVTANAKIKSGLFHTSDQDNVVLGKDGWLYYGSSMDDYLGTETLNDLQLHEIVYNMQLMQTTLEEQGISFVFTISPNKNSLYPQYMPSKYKSDTASRNSSRLLPMLEASDVNFVNLYDLFNSQDQVLYHKTDSHWNNLGAAMVNEQLLSAVGRESTDYSQIDYEERDDFTGDLFSMLYPTQDGTDPEYYYDKERDYSYVTEISSTYDPEIDTVNDQKDGNVVMFRDSFGNSLLPFVADEFGTGYFSRSDPFTGYEIIDRGADTVIAEIVERNLSHLQATAPILASPDVSLDMDLPEETDPSYSATAQTEETPAGESTYLKIWGQMDASRTDENTVTYVSIFDEDQGFGYLYQAYHTSENNEDADQAPYGYCAYADLTDVAYGHYDICLISVDGDQVTRSENLGLYDYNE